MLRSVLSVRCVCCPGTSHTVVINYRTATPCRRSAPFRSLLLATSSTAIGGNVQRSRKWLFSRSTTPSENGSCFHQHHRRCHKCSAIYAIVLLFGSTILATTH